MGIIKKKISEFPLADTLIGLHTLGVDASNKSVKVGLEFVQAAAEIAAHPIYIGEDYFVYQYDLAAHAYKKTDLYIKGERGEAGVGGMIVCDSFEQLLAIADVTQGAMGAVRGKKRLVAGDSISQLDIDTNVVPVFDRSVLTETQLAGEPGVLMMANSLTPTPEQPVNGGLLYFAFGNVDVLIAQLSESNIPIPVYASEAITLDESFGNIAFVQGWQPGVKSLDFGLSTVGFSMEGIAHCDVVTNFDDLFSNHAGTPNSYVFIDGVWEPIGSGQPAQKSTPIIISTKLLSLNNQATSEEIVTAVGGQDIMDRLWNEIADANTQIHIGASGVPELTPGSGVLFTSISRLNTDTYIVLAFINSMRASYLIIQINKDTTSGKYSLTMNDNAFPLK